MKRFLSILSLLLFVTACDDGDLTVDVIDFSEIQAQKCTNKDVIYKIKDNEMLFLEIPAATFLSNQTIVGEPIEVPLSSTIKVTYRKYANTVSNAAICPSVPDAEPNVIEEWKATAGIIQITSTAIKNTNATNNSTRITGYRHYIEFKNITFLKPTGPQLQATFIFGNYITPVSALAFGFGLNPEVSKSTCTNDNRIFDFSGSEVFTLDIADFNDFFKNEVTTTPRTRVISATNKLSYRLYSNAILNAFFCTTPIPATPVLTQQWNAVNGQENIDGTIQVTTIDLGNNIFRHTISLKKVTLKKDNSDFSLGDDYFFGTFDRPNP